MEGVEDIPGVSLEAGMNWRWESFPEYVAALESLPRTLDVGTQMTHGALRAYVMAERGAANEEATADDLVRMAALVREGMAAGALGFSSSRTEVHIDVDGNPVPGTYAPVTELAALGRAVADSGHGLMELVLAGVAGEDVPALDREMSLMRALVEQVACPVMYLQAQQNGDGAQWRRQLAVCEDAARHGHRLIPQVPSRPVTILFSMAGEHPWRFMPSYAAIAHLPPAERVRRMADPDLRARLLAEQDPNDTGFSMLYKSPNLWDLTFPAGDPSTTCRMPTTASRASPRAKASPWAVAYDRLLGQGGPSSCTWSPAIPTATRWPCTRCCAIRSRCSAPPMPVRIAASSATAACTPGPSATGH